MIKKLFIGTVFTFILMFGSVVVFDVPMVENNLLSINDDIVLTTGSDTLESNEESDNNKEDKEECDSSGIWGKITCPVKSIINKIGEALWGILRVIFYVL